LIYIGLTKKDCFWLVICESDKKEGKLLIPHLIILYLH